MEIVYYWVENKENIVNQGFNFSPDIKCTMTKSDGIYFFEIEKTGKRNIMAKEVVSNVTVLVGENGAGKTTLMRCLGNIRCTGEEHRLGDDYKKFEEERNEENRCLYLLREGKDSVQYYIVTNIRRDKFTIRETDIKLTETIYYSDDRERQKSDLREGQGIHGITAVYLTNATYSHYGGSMGTHLGIENIAFMPSGLGPVSNAFFDFIYPEQSGLERNTAFERYSYYLKNKKSVREFQQFCDLFYCGKVLEMGESDRNAILNKKELVVDVLRFDSICEQIYEDGKAGSVLGKSEKIEKFKRICKLEEEKAKHSAVYVLKANFLFEYLLAHNSDTVCRELEDAEPIDSLYENIQLQARRTRKRDPLSRYFKNAAKEIEMISDKLSEAHLRSNTLPIKDTAYKKGQMIDNIAAKRELIKFVVKCINYNNTLADGKSEDKYGSFCLRYLEFTNLGISSGERAFQNLMSWLYWIAKLGNITSSNRVVPKKSLLVCIDEIDALCHPAWQRDIIGEVIDALERDYKGYHIQLVISTHSPLCLSNVPTENTIYLLNDSDGGICQDTSEHTQTFGRNIYDILNDSFYLGGSTIGKYAIDYINELIQDINQIGKTERRSRNIAEIQARIEYVGDPLIKNKLHQLLEEKMWEQL